MLLATKTPVRLRLCAFVKYHHLLNFSTCSTSTSSSSATKSSTLQRRTFVSTPQKASSSSSSSFSRTDSEAETAANEGSPPKWSPETGLRMSADQVRRYAAIDEHHNVISREAGDARTREGKERTEAEEKRPKWLDLRLALLMTLSVGTLFNVFYHLSSGTSGSDLSSEELRSGGMPMRRRSF